MDEAATDAAVVAEEQQVAVDPVLPEAGAGERTVAGPEREKAPLTEEEILQGYTSPIEWRDTPADCVVICCSDPRFEKQNEDFVKALGFSQPHFMQIPSGLAVFASLVAAAGFLHKGMGLLLKKAIELTGVDTVICIGHEDCGGYKAGKYQIVQSVTRRFAGKPIREIQHDHLVKAGKTISRQLGGDIAVRVFYADVVEGQDGDRVKFVHVDSFGHGRRAGRTKA